MCIFVIQSIYLYDYRSIFITPSYMTQLTWLSAQSMSVYYVDKLYCAVRTVLLYTVPYTTPCLKKTTKIVFIRTSSKFH